LSEDALSAIDLVVISIAVFITVRSAILRQVLYHSDG